MKLNALFSAINAPLFTFVILFEIHAEALGKSDEKIDRQGVNALQEGQSMFSCSHSFHWFVPGLLDAMAEGAGIKGHKTVGLSRIGGSKIIQHWNVPEESNKAKQALRGGKVDVLMLSPIYLPDDGIEHFARLALEYNPKIRITIQEFWLPGDLYDPTDAIHPSKVDHGALTIAELRARHQPYFKSLDGHVSSLNAMLGKQVLFVVPVGQAVLALRERIVAGQAPGLSTQEDLFVDARGHPKPPLQILVAYCHFAVIYRRSPVGLPLPAVLINYDGKLNPFLQELAWEAVLGHPLSGVKADVQSPGGMEHANDLSR